MILSSYSSYCRSIFHGDGPSSLALMTRHPKAACSAEVEREGRYSTQVCVRPGHPIRLSTPNILPSRKRFPLTVMIVTRNDPL